MEYALRDVHKPIGVSEYSIARSLPDEFKSSLPSIEEIEAELGEKMSKKGRQASPLVITKFLINKVK